MSSLSFSQLCNLSNPQPMKLCAAGMKKFAYSLGPCRSSVSEKWTNQNCIMFLKIMCEYT